MNIPNYQLRKAILFTLLGFICGWVCCLVYMDFFHSNTADIKNNPIPSNEKVPFYNNH